jgi:hypothetical protein
MLGLASNPSIHLTYLHVHWRVDEDVDHHLHFGNHTLLHLEELAIEISAAYNSMANILDSLTTPKLASHSKTGVPCLNVIIIGWRWILGLA